MLLGVALALVAVGAFWMHQRAQPDDRAAPGVTGTPAARASRSGPPGLDARLLVLGSVPRSYDLRAGKPAIPLGAVTSAVPAGDGGAAWLIGLPESTGETVPGMRPDGSQAGPTYRLPAGTRPVGGDTISRVLTRGAAAAEQVLSWEPDAGSPRVLARGADVLAAAGGTAVLELPSGEIQLLDPYGNRPRRILVELPGSVSGPVSGPVAISRDGCCFAFVTSRRDPRSGSQTDYVAVGAASSDFRGVIVVAGARIQPGHGQVAPQWTRADVLVLADPVTR